MASVPSCAEGDHQRAVHSRRICHTRHPSPSCQRQATISNAQSGLLLRAPIDRLSAEDTSLAPTTQPIISIGIGSTVSSAVDWAGLAYPRPWLRCCTGESLRKVSSGSEPELRTFPAQTP